MRRLRKVGYLTILLTFLMMNTAFAEEWNWEDAVGHHNQSILLDESTTSSEDTVHRYARGDYLAQGSVQIVNMQDGTLKVNITTLAYRNVDMIMHTVFLDRWDADRNDWVNLNHWDFEQTKEESENGELHMLDTYMLLTGYETNRYYRLRGLHGVEFNDEIEACASETDGVLLTNWR